MYATTSFEAGATIAERWQCKKNKISENATIDSSRWNVSKTTRAVTLKRKNARPKLLKVLKLAEILNWLQFLLLIALISAPRSRHSAASVPVLIYSSYYSSMLPQNCHWGFENASHQWLDLLQQRRFLWAVRILKTTVRSWWHIYWLNTDYPDERIDGSFHHECYWQIIPLVDSSRQAAKWRGWSRLYITRLKVKEYKH